jgi:hypothetical protein
MRLTPALTAACIARLIGSTDLVGLVGTFKGQPAIFGKRPVPQGALRPYISLGPVVASTAFDTKDRQGRRIARDIGCYIDDAGVADPVDEMAELVRDLFHRYALPVNGFDTLVTVASGPIVAPTDETVLGRLVMVEWLVRANN